MIMKTIILSTLLFTFLFDSLCLTNSRIGSKEQSCCNVKKGNIKLDRTLSLIINEHSLSGQIENIHYGEMSMNVYDLIYTKRYKLDINQKIDLAAAFLCFQNHYIGAYFNTLLNDKKKKYLHSHKELMMLFAPFKEFSTHMFESSNIDSIFLNTLIPENKLLFQSTDSLLKSALSKEDLELQYKRLLFSHVYSKSFKNRYYRYFFN